MDLGLHPPRRRDHLCDDGFAPRLHRRGGGGAGHLAWAAEMLALAIVCAALAFGLVGARALAHAEARRGGQVTVMTNHELASLKKRVLKALHSTRTLYGLSVATKATEAEVGIALNEMHRAKTIDAHSVHGFRLLAAAPTKDQPFLSSEDW